MKTKIITSTGMFLILIGQAQGMEIRQDMYSYPLPLTRLVQLPTHQAFILTRRPTLNIIAKRSISSQADDWPFLSAVPEKSSFPVVYFDFDSFSLSPEESSRLLNELKRRGFTAPLQVYGYTCAMGKANQNQMLSENRAKTVANLLRAKGYAVAGVEGKGMLLENSPASNRKVEIKPATTH
jgi:hypothetical protein